MEVYFSYSKILKSKSSVSFFFSALYLCDYPIFAFKHSFSPCSILWYEYASIYLSDLLPMVIKCISSFSML